MKIKYTNTLARARHDAAMLKEVKAGMAAATKEKITTEKMAVLLDAKKRMSAALIGKYLAPNGKKPLGASTRWQIAGEAIKMGWAGEVTEWAFMTGDPKLLREHSTAIRRQKRLVKQALNQIAKGIKKLCETHHPKDRFGPPLNENIILEALIPTIRTQARAAGFEPERAPFDPSAALNDLLEQTQKQGDAHIVTELIKMREAKKNGI